MRLLLSIIPVNKNKFFFISLNGNNYGDNIKCLSDFISSHHQNPKIIIWAFTKDYFDKIDCTGTKVKLLSWKYYYHILTSKYIIHNVGFHYWQYRKRKGQIVLNTWHGTALKKLGVDFYKKNNGFLYKYFGYDYLTTNAKNTDIFVSGSRFMSNIYINALLQNKSVIHEFGTPRNDVFFQNRDDIKRRVCDYYSIDEESYIILYAPTFREDFNLDYYDVDLMKIKSLIEQEKKRKVCVVVRWHPKFVSLQSSVNELLPSDAIDGTFYPDMQELLYSSNMLVTDYSSSMFDFMYSYKPVLLYVPDRDLYERGFYLNIDELPFIIVNKNNELEREIVSFNQKEYKKKVDAFLEKIGSVEDGRATEKTYKFLMDNY